MTKRKPTKHEDDVRRNLRKSAEINPAQSPQGLRDTIEEQNAQIEALKQDLLEKSAELRKSEEYNEALCERMQDLNNEVYGLQTQVAALIDDQTRLKAEVERLRKAGDALARIVEPPYDHMKKDEYSMWAAEIDAMNRWNAAKEGKPSV